VYSRRHTETKARTVKDMTMRLHSGPRSSALSAASSSGVNRAMAYQSARTKLRLPLVRADQSHRTLKAPQSDGFVGVASVCKDVS
jgi:hypothetical protein